MPTEGKDACQQTRPLTLEVANTDGTFVMPITYMTIIHSNYLQELQSSSLWLRCICSW
jgi:hypothetical protein